MKLAVVPLFHELFIKVMTVKRHLLFPGKKKFFKTDKMSKYVLNIPLNQDVYLFETIFPA